MIARDAVPIANRSPYKRIDLSVRRRPTKKIITVAEVMDNREPVPDPVFYDQDFYGNWHLKP